MMREVHSVCVHGVQVDEQTRCSHYHTDIDIIAIKFPCCDKYYPCHLCHEEVARHPAKTWTSDLQGERAVLCGVCGYELTIAEYLHSGHHCPTCKAQFNPGCHTHRHLYFDF